MLILGAVGTKVKNRCKIKKYRKYLDKPFITNTMGALGMPETLPQTTASTVNTQFCLKAIFVGIVHVAELESAAFGHWPQLVALTL
jgi:hypothetical protein